MDEISRVIRSGWALLKIVLDPVTLRYANNIRRRHGDLSYTAAIKRAIATAYEIYRLLAEQEPGSMLLVGDPSKGVLREVALPP